jgi:predicted metal-dependent enzyme (double-stranded beta helix superfamily)
VVKGRIEVTQYDLLQNRGERYQFQPEGTVEAGVGGAGTLIPPFEYHTIANAQSETSITLHVYGREMSNCRIFQPCGEGDWYQAADRALAYSA